MSGYLGNDAETKRALVDGWLDTGDEGFLDDGELFLTGRDRDKAPKRRGFACGVEGRSEHHGLGIDRASLAFYLGVDLLAIGKLREGMRAIVEAIRENPDLREQLETIVPETFATAPPIRTSRRPVH